MKRTLFALALSLTITSPALACGDSRAQVALFLGFLFIVPAIGFFLAQATLLRLTQAAFASSGPLIWRLAVLVMTLATCAQGMAAGSTLCDAGLAVFGLPLILLQILPVVMLAKAVFERPACVVL